MTTQYVCTTSPRAGRAAWSTSRRPVPSSDLREITRPREPSLPQARSTSAAADGVGANAPPCRARWLHRANGVCRSMDSLTRIGHAVTPGLRHGRSRHAM